MSIILRIYAYCQNKNTQFVEICWCWIQGVVVFLLIWLRLFFALAEPIPLRVASSEFAETTEIIFFLLDF